MADVLVERVDLMVVVDKVTVVKVDIEADFVEEEELVEDSMEFQEEEAMEVVVMEVVEEVVEEVMEAVVMEVEDMVEVVMVELKEDCAQ